MAMVAGSSRRACAQRPFPFPPPPRRLVIPSIVTGACVGRIVGQASHDVVEYLGCTKEWVDPGLFAFIGAGAMFGGVSRLTISLTVPPPPPPPQHRMLEQLFGNITFL